MSAEKTIDDLTRRNMVGNIPVEKNVWSDNLAVALASYFTRHLDRPEDDEDDAETGWSPWVLRKTDEALDMIAKGIQ